MDRLLDEKTLFDSVVKALVIDSKHPLAGIVEKVAEVIVDKATNGEVLKTVEDAMDYYGAGDEAEINEYSDPEILHYIKAGKTVIVGDFEDFYENPIESFLSNNDLNFEGNGIKFEHNGGY
jgi:uncharacterized membrane-anchored protein